MRLLARVLATAYLAYLAVIFLLVTPALNFLPAWYLKENLGRELRSDIILFNPFTLALELRGAALPEPDGERFLEIPRATVDLSTRSLWQRGWILDELSLQGLYLHVRQIGEDEFNFSDMLPPEEPEPAPGPGAEAAIPGITVHRLALQAEEIRASLETREEPFSTALSDLEIEVTELSTIIEEGRPYRIDASGENGGKFHWEGEVSIPGAYSEGFLLISQVELRPLWLFARPWLNFELHDGRFGIKGSYRLNWADTLHYAIEDAGAVIHNIDIHPLQPDSLPDTSVTLAALTLSGIGVDGTRQHAVVGNIEMEGLAVSGWMEGQQVSLADLFALRQLPADDREASPPSEDSGGQAWTAEISAARLVDSRVRFRSEFTDPPLLEITPLEASLGRVTWPLGGDTPVNFNMMINGQLSSGIDGALNLDSGNGALNYHLTDLPLTWFNPNLPAALKAQLTDGRLATDGRVELAGFGPARIFNEGEISDFSFRLQETQEVLTSWKSLRWDELSIDMQERDVILQQVSLISYAGRVHIHEDGTVNTQKIWQEEVGEQAEEVVEELAQGKPWSVAIPQILISGSEVDFMDESLPINFRTVIGGLNGEILGISTAPGAETRVQVRGAVDGYAPVSLTGTAQPLSQPPAVDLELNFTGVDLALLTPYSANYAGYPIERGLMDLELDYVLKEQRLRGENSLKIAQLKLGEKVDSEDAVDLPLELALALLTDSNGVIQMEVPVEGNVDDPQFDIGSVIGKAFVNIITKAVTAPFRLLANLVGSEEDLQRINFELGSAELGEPGKDKLGQLNEAMAQRPQLILTITGRLNPSADEESLRRQALRQDLLDGGLQETDISSKNDRWVKAVGERYRRLSPPQEGTVSVAQQYDALVARVDLPADALPELAEARAVAVKSYLVNELGLPPNRAVIEKSLLDDPAQVFSGVELNIK